MKLSKYILKTEYNKKILLMSLFTKAVVEMDSSYYESLLNGNINSIDFLEDLQELCIITDNDEAVFDKICHAHKCAVSKNDDLNLTIIPTLRCNMKCKYCYQKNINYKYLTMTEHDYMNIYNFLEQNILQFKDLRISWYGGEPTLELNKIIKFNKKLLPLIKKYNINYFQSISTNSLAVDTDLINIFTELGIDLVETTIAGLKQEHDLIRITHSMLPTFSNVISNICKLSNYFRMILTINVSSKNINSLIKILDYLLSLKNINYENIYITFTRIEISKQNKCDELVIPEHTYHEKVLCALNYALDNKIKICDPTCFSSNNIFCDAYKKYSYTIGPNSLLYKCTDTFNEDFAIGNITKDGKIKISLNIKCKNWLNDNKCLECKFLPYCNGGCMAKRNINDSPCPSEIPFLDEYLKIYYRKTLLDSDFEQF